MNLPEDIEKLIWEFHDEHLTWKKRYNMNLVVKTAFGEHCRMRLLRQELYDELSQFTTREVDFHLLMNHMKHYDRLMTRITRENLPYHMLWTLVRAGKTAFIPWA